MVSVTPAAPRRERSSFKHLGHLKRLLDYLRHYKWVLVAAFFGLLITRFLDAITPLLMKMAIDSLSDPEIPPNVLVPALGMIGIVVVRFFIFVVSRRAMRRISIAVAYDLRKRVFNHIQPQGPNFFNKFSTGDLMSRTINDINMVRMVVSFGAVDLILFIFTLATGAYFMWMLSPDLAVWVVAPLPLLALVGFLLARRMFPYYRDQQEAMAAVNTFTQENLNGIRTIQAMSQEEQEIKSFFQVSTRYAQKVYRATRYNAWINLIMPLISIAPPAFLIFVGGALVLNGEITLGTYTAFTGYMWMVIWPVRFIGMQLSMFVAAAAGTQRLFEILDYEHEIKDSPRQSIPSHLEGRIEFRDLTFSHPGAARPTIENVSLMVEPGETVAILGRVGSGKSTLLKAIIRLIDTPEHSVFIDGQDISNFPVRELRKVVALVPQDPFLFSTTLRENLTYDLPEREDPELWIAADAAGLTDAIKEFSEGLSTMVGERGQTLSGGQKQRATLARGLVRRSPILLLDDCFSAVDTETEEKILSGLTRLRQDRTTLLISHRVSTARHADRILIIDNGRISESGTHDQLIALGGYYADLAAVQSDQDQDRQRKARLLKDLEDESDVFSNVAGAD